MNKYTFGITTAEDFFQKLLEDYNDFCQDKTSSRFALNCVMTAWHLHEWIYKQYELSASYPKLIDYQRIIWNNCPSLKLFQDLANGSKHFYITQYPPTVSESNLHQGGFSNGFSAGFDISRLEIKLNDGTVKHFEAELEIVIDFWRAELGRLASRA